MLQKNKMFKVILLITIITFCSLGILLGENVYADSDVNPDIKLSINADKHIVNSGDEVTVTVAVDSFNSTLAGDTTPQVNIIELEIPIDKGIFEFIGFTDKTAHFGANNNAVYIDNESKIKLVGYNVDGGYDFENIPVVVEFTVKVKDIADRKMKFECSNSCFSNIYMDEDYKIEVNSEIISAEATIYGDANSDGIVDSKDVVMMKKYLAGCKVDIDLSVCDVNADGVVNSKDVVKTMKKLAGYDVVLGEK